MFDAKWNLWGFIWQEKLEKKHTWLRAVCGVVLGGEVKLKNSLFPQIDSCCTYSERDLFICSPSFIHCTGTCLFLFGKKVLQPVFASISSRPGWTVWVIPIDGNTQRPLGEKGFSNFSSRLTSIHATNFPSVLLLSYLYLRTFWARKKELKCPMWMEPLMSFLFESSPATRNGHCLSMQFWKSVPGGHLSSMNTNL